MKKSLLLAVSAFFAWSANAQHRTNLEETLIPTEGKEYIRSNENVSRATTCEDYSLYPFIKGNSIVGEIPFDKNGDPIYSTDGVGQIYYNTSDLAVKGMLIYLSNPGLSAVRSTAHLYDINADTVGNRLTWKEFDVSPGAQQAAAVYFDNPIDVDGNFMISFQLIPDGSTDTVSVAVGAAGRGENLSRLYFMTYDYWAAPYGNYGLDWDFMMFPIYDVELNADVTLASQAFRGDTVSYSVNMILPTLADSMMNFSYWYGAPQLYLDIEGPDGDTLASEYGTFPGEFGFDSLGVHTFKHAAVWFQWSTMFDPNGDGSPAYCVDEFEAEIEIVSPVGLEEIDGLRLAWFGPASELNFNASVSGLMNVYTIDGRLVESHNLNESVSQRVETNQSGVYIIELIHGSERTVIKVMK